MCGGGGGGGGRAVLVDLDIILADTSSSRHFCRFQNGWMYP
jgi:hypothetical protein